MKIYFNAFWNGFIDHTDPVNCSFFINLFNQAFNTICIITNNITDADILCESLFGQSLLFIKNWKYTILFSGESRLRENHDKYSFVLYSKRTYNNIINCPEFYTYLMCNNLINNLSFIHNEITNNIPKNDIVVIISNIDENYRKRLEFIEILEKKYNITYAGKYKNNIGGPLKYKYGSPEFINFISQYKFVIAMENSIEDTYITEKITHGLLAKNIPIYWGTNRVIDYFNKNRYVIVNENNYDETLNEISKIIDNNELFIDKIKQPVFTNNELWINNDIIVNDIKAIINKKNHEKTFFKDIDRILCICNKEKESERINHLNNLFNNLNIDKSIISYIGSSWKDKITNDEMKYYTKSNKIYTLRNNPMKKSEISLFFNVIEVLKEIDRHYYDGLFCIFESDINICNTIHKLPELIKLLKSNINKWDACNIGAMEQHRVLLDEYSEDFKDANSDVRVIRKYDTRYTEAFIFNKKGVIKLLNYLLNNEDYCEPYDCYLKTLCENNKDFVMTWSIPGFIYQLSLLKVIKSYIQEDTI